MAVVALGVSFGQTNTANDAYALERSLALRADISEALSSTLAVEQTAERLLSALATRENQGNEFVLNLGQQFEDRAIDAAAAITSAAFVTAHLNVSSSLETTFKSLEDARNATAVLYGNLPPDGEERRTEIAEVRALWASVIEAANDARAAGYCDLALGYEQKGIEAQCG